MWYVIVTWCFGGSNDGVFRHHFWSLLGVGEGPRHQFFYCRRAGTKTLQSNSLKIYFFVFVCRIRN